MDSPLLTRDAASGGRATRSKLSQGAMFCVGMHMFMLSVLVDALGFLFYGNSQAIWVPFSFQLAFGIMSVAGLDSGTAADCRASFTSHSAVGSNSAADCASAPAASSRCLVDASELASSP